MSGTIGEAVDTILDAHGNQDPEDMNELRRQAARAAIVAFKDATGTDEENALTDLLCNLMHLYEYTEGPIRGESPSFGLALDRALGHHEAECDENCIA